MSGEVKILVIVLSFYIKIDDKNDIKRVNYRLISFLFTVSSYQPSFLYRFYLDREKHPYIDKPIR